MNINSLSQRRYKLSFSLVFYFQKERNSCSRAGSVLVAPRLPTGRISFSAAGTWL